jgi:hypothetical protein
MNRINMVPATCDKPTLHKSIWEFSVFHSGIVITLC